MNRTTESKQLWVRIQANGVIISDQSDGLIGKLVDACSYDDLEQETDDDRLEVCRDAFDRLCALHDSLLFTSSQADNASMKNAKDFDYCLTALYRLLREADAMIEDGDKEGSAWRETNADRLKKAREWFIEDEREHDFGEGFVPPKW